MTKEESFAYCAGYVDGDGTMFITAAKQGRGNGYYFRPTFAVVGIDQRPLDRIAGLLGGNVRPAGEVLRCALHYSSAAKAATKLEPYLLLKREQARLIQGFQNHVDANRVSGPKLMAAGVKQERFDFVAKITAANHKPLAVEQFTPHSRKHVIAAYVAGLLEAEGYFSISKAGGKPAITISVAMTDKNLICWLKDLFGGWSGVLKGKTKAGKPIYLWRIHRQQAFIVIKTIRPYMTFKKEQIDILIRYQNSVNLWNRRTGGVNQFNLPHSVKRQREEMASRLKSLHGRAGATTKSDQSRPETSDSLVFSDGKAEECSRNDCTAA
jgi:hypothetical protein